MPRISYTPLVTSAQHVTLIYTFFEARISSPAMICECPWRWPSPFPLPFCPGGKWATFFSWAMLWVCFPWMPRIPQVLWVPSLLRKSRKLSHSLLIINPALWALLVHSSAMPRLLSSSKFLFDPFPYLVLSSPSQTFPNRSSHNRSPLPSFRLPLNSHHPGFVPSIHQSNDKHHQRLPNQ